LATADSVQDLCLKLSQLRCQFSDEKQLQASLFELLQQELPEVAREVTISPRNRIDFLAGSLGIEVKIKGSLAAVTRQLWRYSLTPAVSELILVTTVPEHAAQPAEMNSKPLFVVLLTHQAF
jgi:hypothetical protein